MLGWCRCYQVELLVGYEGRLVLLAKVGCAFCGRRAAVGWLGWNGNFLAGGASLDCFADADGEVMSPKTRLRKRPLPNILC